jgi:hypothetical protein
MLNDEREGRMMSGRRGDEREGGMMGGGSGMMGGGSGPNVEMMCT